MCTPAKVLCVPGKLIHLVLQRPSAEHRVPRVAPEKQNQLTFRILLGISVLTSDPLWILGSAAEIEDLQAGKLVREELQMEN